jgi:phosphocarrier protein HPr
MMADDVVERTVTIQNEKGFHASAASQFVRIVAKFPCEVTVVRSGAEVNGKSILSLLTLAASKGTALTIRAKGDRAAEVVAALATLVNDKFGEGK